MNENDNEIKGDEKINGLKESACFFMEKKIKAHIVLSNKRFYNGIIIEVKDSILIIDEAKIGMTPIMLRDIYQFERFKDEDYTYVKQSYYQP